MFTQEFAIVLKETPEQIRSSNRKALSEAVGRVVKDTIVPGRYLEGVLLNIDESRGLSPYALEIMAPEPANFFYRTPAEGAERDPVKISHAFDLRIWTPDKKLVGFQYASFIDYGKQVEISNEIFVDEKYRHSGLGTQMLREFNRITQVLIASYQDLLRGKEVIHLYQDQETEAEDFLEPGKGWGDKVLKENGYEFDYRKIVEKVPLSWEYVPGLSRMKIFQAVGESNVEEKPAPLETSDAPILPMSA